MDDMASTSRSLSRSKCSVNLNKYNINSTSKKCKIIWLSLLIGCILVYIFWNLRFVDKPVIIQTYLHQPLPFNKDIPLIRYYDRRGFGFPADAMPNKTALWTRDIQLCIMFNSVIKNKAIGLLLSYYGLYFNHITLISGTKTITKPRVVPDSVQVFNCDSYYGWYQQKCLSICLENPGSDGVKGFLYIADDMFINITKMGELDRTKLWTISFEKFNYTQLIRANEIEKHARWSWFGFPKYVEVGLQKTIGKLPKKWIKALRTNAGFPDNYEIHATSDIFFIPTAFVPETTEVIAFITNTTDLFCEVALPLTVGIVSHPSQRQIFSNGYLWKFSRNHYSKESIAESAHFVHPLKLGHGGDALLWTRLMKYQIQQTIL